MNVVVEVVFPLVDQNLVNFSQNLVNLESFCAWKIFSTAISVGIDFLGNLLLSNVVSISLRQKDNFESFNFIILVLANF